MHNHYVKTFALDQQRGILLQSNNQPMPLITSYAGGKRRKSRLRSNKTASKRPLKGTGPEKKGGVRAGREAKGVRKDRGFSVV